MKNRSWTIHPLPIFILMASLISALCVLVFIGCGSTTDSEALWASVFADDIVVGMQYESGNRTGLTDETGKFYYKEGETVYFKIGGLPIGQTDSPKALTTPIDLVDAENSFVLHRAVTNICRLLQSLDEDSDPTNGILITKETRDRIQALVDGGLTSVNFDQEDSAFTTEVLSSGLFGDPADIVSKADANSHFFKTLAKNLATPVMMVNLGDSLTAGAQNGIENIFSDTQSKGFPLSLAQQIAFTSDGNFEWNFPMLTVIDPLPESDSEEKNYYTQENGFKKRVYRAVYDETADDMADKYLTPYNLAVPGATISSVLHTKTTPPVQSPPDPYDQNDIMTDLYFPIPEMKAKEELGENYNGERTEVTQLEAALFLANQEEHQNKLKIFTLWIGAEDTLGVITQNMGSDLTTDNITQFLNDHSDYEDDLQTIVDALRNVEYAYVFISTLPKVRSLGILFGKDDIIKMAQPAYEYEPDLTASGMTDELIGFKPFIGDYKNPDPNDPTNPSISRCLAKSEDEALLNSNIQHVLLTDANFLSQGEIDLINERIDEINGFIKNTLAVPDNVMVVEIGEDIYEKVGGSGYNIITELNRNTGRMPTEEEYLEDWGEIGIDPLLTNNMSGGFYSFDGYHPSNTGYASIAFLFMNKIVEAGIGLDTAATYKIEGEEYPALDLEITDIQVNDSLGFDVDGDGFIYSPPAPFLFNYHYYDTVTMGGWVDCGRSDATILPYFVAGFQPVDDEDESDFGLCEGYMPAYED